LQRQDQDMTNNTNEVCEEHGSIMQLQYPVVHGAIMCWYTGYSLGRAAGGNT
jgi:hypothetical protein